MLLLKVNERCMSAEVHPFLFAYYQELEWLNHFPPTPGAVVTYRDRQWVVLPSEIPEVVRLRPLNGNEDQVCGIYQPLELEKITPAPKADAIQDHGAAQLLCGSVEPTEWGRANRSCRHQYVLDHTSFAAAHGTAVRDHSTANCG